MTAGRRLARSLALQVLYEADVTSHQPAYILECLQNISADLSTENTEFARSLINGVRQNREVLDNYIQKFAYSFPVEQMPIIDRNILRIAIFELVFGRSVPVEVAINEAVELAKRFGSDNSASFVNGVLGSLCVELINRA